MGDADGGTGEGLAADDGDASTNGGDVSSVDSDAPTADRNAPPADRDVASGLPGVAATPRSRAKSAALWGLVGALAFLALAQGYALAVGSLPVGLLGLLPVGTLIGAVVAVTAYRTEHRLQAKRRV